MLTLFKNWLTKPSPHIYSKASIECIACMLFHFVGSISPTPWANGIMLIVLVYYTAKTSGAHLNPALSLTFTMLGFTNPIEMIVYWGAQITGCILGALWIACLVPGIEVAGTPKVLLYDGCFRPGYGLTPYQVFGWEALCTFSFILPIFSVVWYTVNKRGYGNTGPLIIGLSLIANAFAAGPFTGAAFNPARVLGSYLTLDCGNDAYILAYILGELLGAAMVPLFIMPWYGICKQSWYSDYIPLCIKKRMKNFMGVAPPNDAETGDA